MPDISVIVLIGGNPTTGIVCSAYKSSRFSSLPVPYDTPVPGGAPDAVATSGNAFGGPGQVSLTVPTFEEYWVAIPSGGHIGWVKSPSPVLPESDVTSLLNDLVFRSIKPAVSDAVLYVSQNGNDANDGFSWGSGKLTVPAALAALPTGGGRVKIGGGVFTVDLAAHPDNAAYAAALIVPGNTAIEGQGRDLTIVRLRANQTLGNDVSGSNQMVLNRHISAGGDEQITLTDLTFDGNAANQTHTIGGIGWMRTRGVRHNRVQVMNCRGTATSGVNETFHFETQLGADTFYTDCDVVGNAGSTASGFSADSASGVHYTSCVAFGMSVGQGFTHNNCRGVQHVNCHSYLNTSHGFNSEVSDDVIYTNCRSGGKSVGSAGYPFAANTSLGNGGLGICLNLTTHAQVIGCSSRGNTQGVDCTGGSGVIVGGDFSGNTSFGIGMDAAAAQAFVVTGRPFINGNGTAAMAFTTGYLGGYGPIAAPAVPASNTALVNPWPFEAFIYISGGSVTSVDINLNPTGFSSPGIYRLGPGESIRLIYTAAPTWFWSVG